MQRPRGHAQNDWGSGIFHVSVFMQSCRSWVSFDKSADFHEKEIPLKKTPAKPNTEIGVKYSSKGFNNILVPVDLPKSPQDLFRLSLKITDSINARCHCLAATPVLVDGGKPENMVIYYLAQKRLFPGDLQERIKKISEWNSLEVNMTYGQKVFS